MLLMTGAKGWTPGAAVQPDENIRHTFVRCSGMSPAIDNDNWDSGRRARWLQNNRARNKGRAQSAHLTHMEHMFRRMGDYYRPAERAKRRGAPAMLMRKPGNIAHITGSGMPVDQFDKGGHAKGKARRRRARPSSAPVARRPRRARPDGGAGGDAAAAAAAGGGTGAAGVPRARPPSYLISAQQQRADTAAAQHASPVDAADERRRQLRLVQRELASRVVNERLFREADLEALFRGALQQARGERRRELVREAIAQLRVELELEARDEP
eukprot:g2622.t1